MSVSSPLLLTDAGSSAISVGSAVIVWPSIVTRVPVEPAADGPPPLGDELQAASAARETTAIAAAASRTLRRPPGRLLRAAQGRSRSGYVGIVASPPSMGV